MQSTYNSIMSIFLHFFDIFYPYVHFIDISLGKNLYKPLIDVIGISTDFE